MSKIILCRGIQGSGKTTWAKQWVLEDPEHRVRFNNDDDVRNMLGKYCGKPATHEGLAPNAEEANGMYNGSPQDYLITKTEEIVVPPCCGLMAEQTVEFFNNN